MAKIFFIKRTYADSIVLHPFRQKKDIIELVEKEAITVLYSHKPAEDETLHAHYKLYSLIDDAVNNWIQELKYIPRLIWSALTFLLLYFFTSFAIRDVIPLVDEILISGGGAVAVYMYVASKNRKSDLASKRRIELKEVVDASLKDTEPALVPIEEALNIYDEMPIITLADILTGREQNRVKLNRNKTTEDVFHNMEIYFAKDTKKNRKYISKILSLRNEKDAEILSSNLLQLGNTKKIDLPLIALYITLKKLY
ncbi:MAG: hypothetical protein K9L75_01155 [Spirochaetia bacterium]|nr:hypothetical protein [Spirochaetia bacterium]